MKQKKKSQIKLNSISLCATHFLCDLASKFFLYFFHFFFKPKKQKHQSSEKNETRIKHKSCGKQKGKK